jgi:type IV pilus assembly protein PilB
MGVPSFLIASTLKLSVAQRLVRILCDRCKVEMPIDISKFPKNFNLPKDLNSQHHAVGCNTCHHTGYKGRKAIYEILPINRELSLPIKNNNLEIKDYMAKNNIDTLKTNAIEMIKNGTTSVEEVYTLLTE